MEQLLADIRELLEPRNLVIEAVILVELMVIWYTLRRRSLEAGSDEAEGSDNTNDGMPTSER